MNLVDLIIKKSAANGAGQALLVTFLNPYSYLLARRELEVFRQFDCINIDGVLLKWMMLLAGHRAIRKSFDMTSLAPRVLGDLVARGGNVFFVGGPPGIAESAAAKLVSEFPGLRVLGAASGYFGGAQERASLIAEISKSSSSIVVVGMGTPLQEKFLVDLKNANWSGVGYTCGGFLHQTAKGGVGYYPAWVDKLNLRAVYRMLDEPRLSFRYFYHYPKFFFVFVRDLAEFWLRRRESTT